MSFIVAVIQAIQIGAVVLLSGALVIVLPYFAIMLHDEIIVYKDRYKPQHYKTELMWRIKRVPDATPDETPYKPKHSRGYHAEAHVSTPPGTYVNHAVSGDFHSWNFYLGPYSTAT